MSEQAVQVGMLLVVKEERFGRPTRFDWWVVKGVRKLKSGAAKVTLVSGSDSMSAEATATFPGGVVRDPWHVVNLSQADWALIWNAPPKAVADNGEFPELVKS